MIQVGVTGVTALSPSFAAAVYGRGEGALLSGIGAVVSGVGAVDSGGFVLLNV